MNLPKGDAYAMAFRLEGQLCAVHCTKAENSLSTEEAQRAVVEFLANFNDLNLLSSFSVEFWSRDQHEDWINGRLD
jgi:hypothetical protein